MLDKVNAQHQIIAAERGDLEPVLSVTTAMTLLNDVADLFSKHEIIKDKELYMSENLTDVARSSSAAGISPTGSHGTVRDSLPSYGSYSSSLLTA